MKKVIFNTGLSGLFAVLTFLALPAQADCLSGPLCGGTSPTIPEQPANNFSNLEFNFNAATHSVGNGQTKILEGVGEVYATRDSESSVDFKAFLNSDLCPGGCEDGGFNASLRVNEHVASGGYAFSEGGPNTVAAIHGANDTFVSGSLGVTFPSLED